MRARLIFLGLSVLTGLTLALAATLAAAEVMTNADVLEMTRAGIAPDIISSKITSTGGSFDLSTRAILELGQNQVADNVIRAMMTATPA
ncbi:MAG: hypothetical protein LBU79_06435, partial [Planctomycetota bacterium]|nr:hypothetical protein [Planctomycetota bacterium]